MYRFLLDRQNTIMLEIVLENSDQHEPYLPRREDTHCETTRMRAYRGMI